MQILPTSGAATAFRSEKKSAQDFLDTVAAADSAGQENLKTDDTATAETPADLFHKLTKDGLDSLVRYQLEELRKKITEQVMKDKGVTEESLAAMTPAERKAIEDAIAKEVEERLKQALKEQQQEQQQARKIPGTANIAVPAPAESGSLLLATQKPAERETAPADPNNKLARSPFEDLF